MKDPLHRALVDTQADLEDVSSHLALIREAIEHGESAASREDLARRLSVSLVATLGFETVAILFAGNDGELETVATYGQTERFGGPREPHPDWAIRLGREVLDEGTLLRWGGDGVGPSRSRPRDLEEDVIGLPLEASGEVLGALMCTEIGLRPWTLARHRALELIGRSMAQVVALQRSRREGETARQTLELELRAARTKLARQEERIGALSSSLDSADRVKQTFLGLLSHELRTPLAAILGYSSLLREGEAGETTEAQDRFLGRIESNGRRLGYLLDDLLFLTEAESTRIRPARAQVELAPLVEAVSRALPDPAEGTAPELKVAIEPGAERLQGDPALVRRLLFHLLDGAWRAAPGGTVLLEAVAAEPGHVRLSVRSRAGPGATTAPEPAAAPGTHHVLGQSLVRLCISLLDGRSRLPARAAEETRAEVWIPSAKGTAKAGLGRRRTASGGRPAGADPRPSTSSAPRR